MSGSVAGLTIAFIQSRPQAAARVLDDLEPAEAAAFLASVPSRLAAPLLSRMQPARAARVVSLQPPEIGAAMVRAMLHLDCVTVVRLLSDEKRRALYAELPERIVKDVRRSLEYPRETVGAWMDLSIAMLPESTRADEARRYVRRGDSAVLHHVFVTGSGHRLEGAVSVVALIRADDQTRLGEIVDSHVAPLSNRALLRQAAELPAWDVFGLLPVVGRKGNVLGALSQADLRRGLAEIGEDGEPAPRARMTSQLFDAWLVAASGMSRVLLGRGPS